MPKFRIRYGLSRIEEESVLIEAETLEEAEGIAQEGAMEIVGSWLICQAEPVEDEES